MESGEEHTHNKYSDEQYEELLEQFKWCTAIVSILVDEAGGVVEIDPETLEGLDLRKAQVRVKQDTERNVYIVEGVYEDATE